MSRAGLVVILSVLMVAVMGQNKPGFCPRPRGVAECLEECSDDNSCTENLKCCSNGCGHVCTIPTSTGMGHNKPGFCPSPRGPIICKYTCSDDDDCVANLKCCSNGRCLVCMVPDSNELY